MSFRNIVIAAIVAMLTVASPALADPVVVFDMSGLVLNYDVDSRDLKVEEISSSTMYLLYQDDVTLATYDSVTVANSAVDHQFDLMISLKMVDELDVNNWSATGRFEFTDKNSDKVLALFKSTSVSISSGQLSITGSMTTVGPPESDQILQPSPGEPWQFAGTGQWDLDTDGDGSLDNGVDGTPNQISVESAYAYDGGTLTTLKFGVGGHSLDSFFGADRPNIPGGQVRGEITPVPAALGLGLLGLGLMGWRMRRYA